MMKPRYASSARYLLVVSVAAVGEGASAEAGLVATRSMTTLKGSPRSFLGAAIHVSRANHLPAVAHAQNAAIADLGHDLLAMLARDSVFQPFVRVRGYL